MTEEQIDALIQKGDKASVKKLKKYFEQTTGTKIPGCMCSRLERDSFLKLFNNWRNEQKRD